MDIKAKFKQLITVLLYNIKERKKMNLGEKKGKVNLLGKVNPKKVKEVKIKERVKIEIIIIIILRLKEKKLIAMTIIKWIQGKMKGIMIIMILEIIRKIIIIIIFQKKHMEIN